MQGALGGVHDDVAVGFDHVALDPGARDVGLERDLVLHLAGLDAEAAAHAVVVGVHQKGPAQTGFSRQDFTGVEPFQGRERDRGAGDENGRMLQKIASLHVTSPRGSDCVRRGSRHTVRRGCG